MKSKRVFSFVLAALLLLSLVPVITQTAAAWNDPSYHTVDLPEVALFNAYTGNDAKFYESVMSGSNYNAVEAGYFGSLRYKTKVSGITSYQWPTFASSKVYALRKDNQDIQVGFSVTRNSKNHKHSAGIYDYKMTSYSDVGLGLVTGGMASGGLISFTGANKTQDTQRYGNNQFRYIPLKDRYMDIAFNVSVIRYHNNEKTCSCGGSVENCVVCFYDGNAPYIGRMEIKNGSTYATNFKPGDDINIELTCSEPIRFASGSAAGMGNVSIALKENGNANSYIYAHLTKLDGDTLTFTYHVDEQYDKLFEVAGVDLGKADPNGGIALLNSSAVIDLKQVRAGSAFTVTKPSDSEAIGITKTTSPVTDIAGNALFVYSSKNSTLVPRTFHIDGEKPYAVAAGLFAITNNSNVKEARGVQNLQPGTGNYDDKSDTYLGVGDKLSISVYMNELVSGGRARITTNIKKSDDSYVWVYGTPISTAQATVIGSQYGRGASNGSISVLQAPNVEITDGMTIDDTDGKIRITSVVYEGYPMTDKAGNVAQPTTATFTPQQQYHLDTVGPVIAQTDVGRATGRFYVQFQVTDDMNKDGVAEMPAFFVLNGSGTPPLSGAFQYAVTANTEEPGASDWAEGVEGQNLPFTQTGDIQYLHVKPIAGQNYDVDRVSFTLEDYAGNTSTTAAIALTDVGMDTVGPAIAGGNTERTYDNAGSTGTLTASIRVSDPSKVKTVQYAWVYSTSADVEPAAGDWENATGTLGETTVDMTATVTVGTGNAFKQYLWVKATDNADNVSVKNLGQYSYNLAGVRYTLDYTTAVIPDPSVWFKGVESGGTLVVDVQKLNESTPTHYIKVCNNFTGAPSDIFNHGQGSKPWFSATFSDEINDDGRYHFTGLSNQGTTPFNQNYAEYTGDLLVTVYSGLYDQDIRRDGGFTDDNSSLSTTDIHITSAAKVETFTLHISGRYNGLSDVFSGMDFSGFVPWQLSVSLHTAQYVYDENETGYLGSKWIVPSMEGIQASFDLGTDKYGWGVSDIDWENSYIALGDENNQNQVKLCGIGSGLSQTITLPASDLYTTGRHYLNVYLYRRSVTPGGGGYGGSGYYYNNDYFYIDATEPGTLSLGTLARKASYSDGYDALAYDPDSTIYIPTQQCNTMLSVDVMDLVNGELVPHQVVKDIKELDRAGDLDIIAWRTNAPSTKVHLSHNYLTTNNGVVSLQGIDDTSSKRTLTFEISSATYDATNADKGILGLYLDQDNVIALQARYANGKASEIVYLTVHPVSIQVEGTVTTSPLIHERLTDSRGLVTGDPGKTSVVFTPAEGQSTVGLTLYCQEGYLTERFFGSTQRYSKFKALPGAEPREMTLQSDGSFTMSVYTTDNDTRGIVRVVNGAVTSAVQTSDLPQGIYFVYGEDKYGNRVDLGISPNAVLADGAAPVILAEPIDYHADGTYTAAFRIYDDSLYSAWHQNYENYRYPIDRPMALTLSFGGAYADLIGASVTGMSLTDVNDGFSWTPDGVSPLGITSVTATRSWGEEFHGAGDISYAGCAKDAYMTVTVQGIVSPKAANTAMTLSLAATDCHGNAAEAVETDPVNVTGVMPTVVSKEYKKVDPNASTKKDDRALYLTFNMPVQPVESWINRSIEGFATEWHDAFPIWKDGTWDISFTDIFGTTYTQPLVLDNVIGKYGFELSFSTLDYVPASEGVTVSVAKNNNQTSELYVTRGTLSLGDESMTFTENGIYWVAHGSNNESGHYELDYLPLRLNNIVSGGPDVTLFFYFEEFGQQYRQDAIPAEGITTTAPVTVSYRTSRETSPEGDTTVTLKGGEDAFSLQYYDAPTNFTYTISDTLSHYGITVNDPPVPYADEDAPFVEMVTIWKQQGGGFVQTEAFTGSADADAVRAAIASAGQSQGYNFVVNASDYSNWRVLVRGEEPTNASTFNYDDAVGSNVHGVAVQGNNVLVSEDVGTFYIIAVDNAPVDSAAQQCNFACLTVPGGSYCFDTKAPSIATATVAPNLYSRVVYIKVADEDDAGRNVTDKVTLSGTGVFANPGVDGQDLTMAAYQYKLEFTENNAPVVVTAVDGAGNSTTATITVTGIDTDAPVLSVTWSPCFKDPTTGKLDKNSPTVGPVNTDVVAHITSDKEIMGVEAGYETGLGAWEPYRFDTFDAYNHPDWGYIDFTSQRVTVHFTDSLLDRDSNVAVMVTAPNGRSSTVPLTLKSGVIDKRAPYVTDSEFYTVLKREGYDVPYAVTLRLRTDEEVFCANYGPAGKIYSQLGEMLEVTVTDLTEKQTLIFMDKAGNQTVFTIPDNSEKWPLEVQVIDSVAPTLSVLFGDATNAATSAAVTVTVKTDEPCTLTASDPSVTCGALTLNAADGKYHATVSATKNGTFRLTAADQAGNTATATFTIGNIDRTLPTIGFSPSTVNLRQDSDPAELTALLNKGVSTWDNVDVKPGSLHYDASAVLLDTVGVYAVTYTVEDVAGNAGQAVRYVKIVDKNQPIITVDGVLTEENGMTSLKTGAHTLSVSGLKTPDEPYTLKLARGIWSTGQLKRTLGDIAIGADGSFTLAVPGFYTLYVTTQSRQTYRTLLYVEN